MKKAAVSIFLTLILIFLQITPTFAAVRRAQAQPSLNIKSGIAYCGPVKIYAQNYLQAPAE